jgi:hypothetical protein
MLSTSSGNVAFSLPGLDEHLARASRRRASTR